MARLRWLVAVVLVVGAACAPTTTTSTGETLGPGPWKWREILPTAGPTRSQGVATDPADGANGDVWYSSQFTIEKATSTGASLGVEGSLPPDVVAELKVSHTGDLDVNDGTLVVPWENLELGPSNPPAKAWGVYDASTLQLEGWARHVLVPGETADNPWVTISPDGRWIVSGPYQPLDRLEVFPMPAPPYADEPLVATIPLDQPGEAVQGCDFVNDTELVCASNDDGTGKQVFTLDLNAPLGPDGTGATSAHLTYEGAAPQAAPSLAAPLDSVCKSSGEVEGIDAHHVAGIGTIVRLLVIDRCVVTVHLYEHVIPD